MSYLDRDGVSIYYEQHGAGPAVLLSHGYSASARMWQGQVEALADNYHVIAWDMRGHDRSDSPDDPALYSHEATIHDMAAVLDACGVGRAIIAGLSLGGFMSLAFYLAHPTRTEALMLFDTGPGYKKDDGRARMEPPRGQRCGGVREEGPCSGWRQRRSKRRAASQRAGPGACGARDVVAEGRPRDRVAAGNRGADTGAGRRERPAVPAVGRLHGGKNSRRGESDPRASGSRRQYRSARSVQFCSARVSRTGQFVAVSQAQ